MKPKILIIILSGVLFLMACEKEMQDVNENSDFINKSGIPETGIVESFTIHSPSLEGNLLGDPTDRAVNIYLPKSYYSDPEKHFPVIYFLHGTPAWGNMLLDPLPFEYFYQMAQLAERVDFPGDFLLWVNDLVDNQGMEETIIVMPDAKTLFGPSLYLNSEVQGNYENYIVNDLVSYVDSHYRTISHFNWRAITGHCAGGYGAFNIAMKHPHVFRYVGALSPPHFPEETMLAVAGFMLVEDEIWSEMGAPTGPIPYDPFQPFKFANNAAYAMAQASLPNPEKMFFADLPFTYIDGTPVAVPELMDKWNDQNLIAQVQKHKIGLKQLKTVYFDCGEYDDLGMYLPNVMLDEKLNEMKIKHDFEIYPGTHISNLYDRLGKIWVKLSNEFPEYEGE